MYNMAGIFVQGHMPIILNVIISVLLVTLLIAYLSIYVCMYLSVSIYIYTHYVTLHKSDVFML